MPVTFYIICRHLLRKKQVSAQKKTGICAEEKQASAQKKTGICAEEKQAFAQKKTGICTEKKKRTGIFRAGKAGGIIPVLLFCFNRESLPGSKDEIPDKW